jgi:hypothetical protein
MKHRLLWFSVFAVAMAYLEAAVVVYLRELLFPENILVIFPLRVLEPSEVGVELGREFATLVMLASVARLAESDSFTRGFAAFAYLFGLWDLFYYAWLKVLIGWPVAWLEWDILFLIPWTWLAHWITAAAIAALLVIWGLRVLISSRAYAFSRTGGLLFPAGAALAVTAFLQPALSVVLNRGVQGLVAHVPEGFW